MSKYLRFLGWVLLIAALLYALSWGAYWLGRMNAKHSITERYGSSTRVRECTGGITTQDVLVDRNIFELDAKRASDPNKPIPTLLLPFFVFDNYDFTYYYRTDNTTRVAAGTVNAFGNLHETNNTVWEYKCFVNQPNFTH